MKPTLAMIHPAGAKTKDDINPNRKHGCWDEVFLAFEGMPRKSLVTWNSMVPMLARNEFAEECKDVFVTKHLASRGHIPRKETYV
ncbi:hypothetical protein Fmac_021553 [Flemingia macrophylla]|uniref:Uncharacterized protein n=1 Tax=Flemingia macrophylla TaxID=520843 RepID=A0ABD1LX97_9FABA